MSGINKQDFRAEDEYGNLHFCSWEGSLGAGGQGVVLRVANDDNTAIKFELSSKGTPQTDPARIEASRREIRKLRLLPINANLNISMPLAALKSHAGYVMRLFGGVRPLTALMPGNCPNQVASMKLPAWMGTQTDEANMMACKKIAFYAANASLRKRLRILLETAIILADLHGQNLVFGDLSHRNLLVNLDAALQDGCAWLIDVDNIRYEGQPAGVRTANYCAPETYGENAGGNPVALCASDAYSFAILAFELLAMEHPFNGPGLEDCELDQMTRYGAPWILDSQDKRNAESNPLIFARYLTPAILDLCAQTFEAGRPDQRPPLAFWIPALARSHDLAMECPQCGVGYCYTAGNSECAFCGAPAPERVVMERNGIPIFAASCQENRPIEVPARVFGPVAAADDYPAVELIRADSGLKIRAARPENAITINGAILEDSVSLANAREGIELALAGGAWPVRLLLEEPK